MTRVVYLGNLIEALSTLAGTGGVEMGGWVGEDPDRELAHFCRENRILPYFASSADGLHQVLERMPPFDIGVIANFGIILKKRTLALPKLGFVNVHLGLLPEFPGRTPVRDAIHAGAQTAGITLHRVTEVIDGGPVIARKTVAVSEGGRDELYERLVRLVPDILRENWQEIVRRPQAAAG